MNLYAPFQGSTSLQRDRGICRTSPSFSSFVCTCIFCCTAEVSSKYRSTTLPTELTIAGFVYFICNYPVTKPIVAYISNITSTYISYKHKCHVHSCPCARLPLKQDQDSPNPTPIDIPLDPKIQLLFMLHILISYTMHII